MYAYCEVVPEVSEWGVHCGGVEGEEDVRKCVCANGVFRCQDRKGSFFVETTAWEGERK